MDIIRQSANRPAATLPDFCNLGVMLRILLAVDGASLVAASLRGRDWNGYGDALMDLSIAVQPVLLASLLALCALRRWLRPLSYPVGVAATLALVLLVTTVVHGAAAGLAWLAPQASLPHHWLYAASLTGCLLLYFNLRERALSPAIGEARLAALQARIRPHFLFNSLNAVLSLIRSDPRHAERALEDLADLYRVLMADNRRLTRLADEVTLCRQYLELEQLRLGERLRIVWHVDKLPADALVPPLVLQPLAENAIHHGVEPAEEGGEIHLHAYRSRDRVHLQVSNPYRQEGSHHAGNKMALSNIRERLALHFDAEAELTTRVGEGSYQVHIVLPYVTEAAE